MILNDNDCVRERKISIFFVLFSVSYSLLCTTRPLGNTVLYIQYTSSIQTSFTYRVLFFQCWVNHSYNISRQANLHINYLPGR